MRLWVNSSLVGEGREVVVYEVLPPGVKVEPLKGLVNITVFEGVEAIDALRSLVCNETWCPNLVSGSGGYWGKLLLFTPNTMLVKIVLGEGVYNASYKAVVLESQTRTLVVKTLALLTRGSIIERVVPVKGGKRVLVVDAPNVTVETVGSTVCVRTRVSVLRKYGLERLVLGLDRALTGSWLSCQTRQPPT